jgi:hypothetical protein
MLLLFVRKYNENFLYFMHSLATLHRTKFYMPCLVNLLAVKQFDFFLKFLVKIFNKNS